MPMSLPPVSPLKNPLMLYSDENGNLFQKQVEIFKIPSFPFLQNKFSNIQEEPKITKAMPSKKRKIAELELEKKQRANQKKENNRIYAQQSRARKRHLLETLQSTVKEQAEQIKKQADQIHEQGGLINKQTDIINKQTDIISRQATRIEMLGNKIIALNYTNTNLHQEKVFLADALPSHHSSIEEQIDLTTESFFSDFLKDDPANKPL
jgi:hypothetical protein